MPVDVMYGNIDNNTAHEGMCQIEYVEWVKNAMTFAFSSVADNVKKSAERQARNYNVGTNMRSFNIGDWVWVFYPPKLRDKFGRGWVGPYLVIKKLGTVDYLVQKDAQSRPTTVHVDHVKAYNHNDMPAKWLETKAQRDSGTQTELSH